MNLCDSDSAATLLARLLELPAVEREEFLRLVHTTDPELGRRLIASMPDERLAPHTLVDPGSANDQRGVEPAVGAVWAFEAALAATETENSGAKIGPYKLLQKIGEGGFGVVWMADQTEPIKRRVALKIIKVGMDTEEVIVRFEAERQALALMEHPNIAHVFDAGATDSGRPYFVMELVRGVAITRYCDDNRLSAEARLRLFITVCQAVQHAHQKGVIHRDLKPSNILVTLHDGAAVPKIIDFGIAKATSARLTEKTLFTQFNAFIGTPAYTSPEQMEMSGLDVDTRSDIYSLGVLLYELLTGQPPFDSNALVKSGLEAMRRTVREIDPPRPSHCLGTLSQVERTAVAHHRGTDATKLSLLLRGDLDWIAMRCLEKDRTRRYDSATGLAADIERHLSDDLVEARPPSQIYRTKKFIRRHKVGVFAATAIAASLIAGLITSSALFVSERAAHNRATVAEKTEGELRRQAEAAQASEAKRAARTALDLANRNLADGHVADGLAYLVYASQKDPKNTALGPRLASALATHNFLLPEGPAFECGSAVLAVHFTKDRRSIYVGTENGVFRVFDAESGALQHEVRLGRQVLLGGWEFPRDNDGVFTVRFPDRAFGVYEVKSGRPRWPLQTFDPMVWQDGESVARGHGTGISPDGRWLYALGVDRFWLWDAVTGSIVIHSVFGSADLVGGCDFTRDGSQFALTLGTTVNRWTLPDGRPIAPFEAGEQQYADSRYNLRTVKFSPNGRIIAVSGVHASVTLFDATTGNRIRALAAAGGFVEHTSVTFASDSRVFAAGRLKAGSWHVTTGEFTPLPIVNGADLLSSSFDAAGRFNLIATANGSATLCDLVSGTQVAEPTGRQDRVCAALAPDGVHIITGNAAGALQRFRVGRGSSRPLEVMRTSPTAAAFLPEAPSRLLVLRNTDARILDVASGRESAGGFSFPAPVLHQVWTRTTPPIRSDAKFVVVPTGRGLEAWEIGVGGIINVATLEDSPARPAGTTFSPGGDLVALYLGRNRLKVWNLRTGALVGPEYISPNYIRALTPQFSPDGKHLAFGSADGTSMIIDVATALPIIAFATRALVPVYGLRFSPDGTRVVTLNDRNETGIWNAVTGRLIRWAPETPDTKMLALSHYTPDGRWFATWGVHAIHLWNGMTGARAGESIPIWHGEGCFSADNLSLGTADGNGVVRVWDVPSGQPFTEPMRFGKGFKRQPQFSPDGRFLSAEHPLKYVVWSVPPRLPEGTPAPAWLHRLGTVLAAKSVNAAGELIDVPSAISRFDEVRSEIAALPAGAPLAEWGRWILNNRADRPIAPGFTFTKAQSDQVDAATTDEP